MSGLLDAAQHVATGAVTLARMRVELFGAELQAELRRAVNGALGMLAALLLAALGAVFAALALLIATPEQYQALVAALIALVLLGGALALAWRIRRTLGAGPQPFTVTLAELDRDRETLRAALAPLVARTAQAEHLAAGLRSALGWAVQLAPLLALLRRR